MDFFENVIAILKDNMRNIINVGVIFMLVAFANSIAAANHSKPIAYCIILPSKNGHCISGGILP